MHKVEKGYSLPQNVKDTETLSFKISILTYFLSILINQLLTRLFSLTVLVLFLIVQ